MIATIAETHNQPPSWWYGLSREDQVQLWAVWNVRIKEQEQHAREMKAGS